MSDEFQNQRFIRKTFDQSELVLSSLVGTEFQKCLFPNLVNLEVIHCPANLFISCYFPELKNLKVVESSSRTFVTCLFPKITNPFNSPQPYSSPILTNRSPSYPDLSGSPGRINQSIDNFFTRSFEKPIDRTRDPCELIRSNDQQEFHARSSPRTNDSDSSDSSEKTDSSEESEESEESDPGPIQVFPKDISQTFENLDKPETPENPGELEKPETPENQEKPETPGTPENIESPENNLSLSKAMIMVGFISAFGLAMINRK